MLIQNLKPGALARLGLRTGEAARRPIRGSSAARSAATARPARSPSRKAYDLLVQAESGLSSITGGPEAPARVGISIVDIATGATAHAAILEALIGRGITGEGADIRVSMFDVMADWLTVPLLHQEAGQAAAADRPRPSVDRALRRLRHPRRQGDPDLDPERPGMGEVLRGVPAANPMWLATSASPPTSRASGTARRPTRLVAAAFAAARRRRR